MEMRRLYPSCNRELEEVFIPPKAVTESFESIHGAPLIQQAGNIL